MRSLSPLTSRIGARLGRKLEGDTVELSPVHRRHRPPAIALPGEVERGRGFLNLDPLKVRHHFTEGEDVHPATTATLIRDAIAADGCIYARDALLQITSASRRPVLWGSRQQIDEAQLVTTHCGAAHFGDWLMVDAALELLAEQRGMTPLAVTAGDFKQARAYRDAFELIEPTRPRSIIQAARLWLVEDNGMTANRLARYHQLRSRAGVPNRTGTRRLFIERGKQDRDPANHSAAMKALRKRGFESVHPEAMSVDELRDTLATASICAGIEGSHLCHATMLMPSGGALLVLMPADRFTDALKWFTDALAMRFAYTVYDGAGVNVRRLNATLDLLERAL